MSTFASTLRQPFIRIALLVLASTLPARPALAGDRIELTVSGGYRTGIVSLDLGIDCALAEIIGPCPDMVRGEDDTVLGLTLDVPVAAHWMIEVRLDHQSTFARLTASEFGLRAPTGTTFIAGSDLDITSLLVGGLRWWRVGGVEPFVSLSAGIADIDLDPVFFEPSGLFDQHLIVAVGSGVKLRPDARLGARLELRGIWFDLPGGSDTFGLVEKIGRDTASELSAGVIVRF